jgi:hypothetical protein
MVPLAVYALDYPRVPLMLIDFHSDRVKRREVIRRAAGDVASSVFGLTPYSSLSWFTARTGYSWVRDRHGAAFDRSMRLASYARLRQTLLDTSDRLDPNFTRLVESKLDAIALNPFEQGTTSEAALAQRQYATLLNRATDPERGLTKTLQNDRAREYDRKVRSAPSRAVSKTLRVASLGLWKPGRPKPAEVLAALNRSRRTDFASRREADALAAALPAPSPKNAASRMNGAGQ